jgi:hypothetical protein
LNDAEAAIVPESLVAAAAAISRFDANCNGLIDFGDFVRAVNAPDELVLYFQEKRLPALADVLRVFVGSREEGVPVGTVKLRAACITGCRPRGVCGRRARDFCASEGESELEDGVGG